MKIEVFLENLKHIGLSDNESRVYLALLSLGSASAGKIALGAGIKRTTVYPVTESLRLKGLISLELQGSKRLYVVENPEQLHVLMEARKKSFDAVMPDFLGLYHVPAGDSVKYYTGLASVKTVYEQLLKELKKGDEYLVISDTARWLDLDREYFEQFIERRSRLRPQMRMITVNSTDAQHYQKFQRNFSSEIKILNRAKPYTTALTITPRKIVLLQMTPPVVTLVIDNPSMVQVVKDMFEMLWATLPVTELPRPAKT